MNWCFWTQASSENLKCVKGNLWVAQGLQGRIWRLVNCSLLFSKTAFLIRMLSASFPCGPLICLWLLRRKMFTFPKTLRSNEIICVFYVEPFCYKYQEKVPVLKEQESLKVTTRRLNPQQTRKHGISSFLLFYSFILKWYDSGLHKLKFIFHFTC